MTEAGPNPNGEGLSVVEALDWRAMRTWAVILSVILGCGAAASVVASALKLFILLTFDHLDIEKMRIVSKFFFLALIIALWLFIASFHPRLVTEDRSWLQTSRHGKRRTSLSLLVLWLGPTSLLAWWLHSAFFAAFDFGPEARFDMILELGSTVVLCTPLLEAALRRWGQAASPRDR